MARSERRLVQAARAHVHRGVPLSDLQRTQMHWTVRRADLSDEELARSFLKLIERKE